MKTALSTLLLFISVSTCSAQVIQRDSSEAERIKKMESEIHLMQTNLYKSHDRFKSGLELQLVGIIGSAAVMQFGGPTYDGLAVGLLGFTAIGTVIMIDSNKFIGRASGMKSPKNE